MEGKIYLQRDTSVTDTNFDSRGITSLLHYQGMRWPPEIFYPRIGQERYCKSNKVALLAYFLPEVDFKSEERRKMVSFMSEKDGEDALEWT